MKHLALGKTAILTLLLAGLSATALASPLDGWFAAGGEVLESRALSELRACGAGGESVRAAFAVFTPGEYHATARALESGECDLALSGTPGGTTRDSFQQAHPTRFIYEIRGGALVQIRAGSDRPPWYLLGRAGESVVAVTDAVLCGTGPWRNEYRRIARNTSNIWGMDERLQRVTSGSCDYAVLSHEEFDELGDPPDGFVAYGLHGEEARPL